MFYKKKKGKQTELKKWIDKLDKVVSLYVRMRDSAEFHYKYFRCISCGKIKPIEMADCGHYMSRRHMSLRFDTRNVNAECSACNRFSSDHLVGYRENLIMKLGKQEFLSKHPNQSLNLAEVKKLGTQEVKLLELLSKESRKWSVFELQQLYVFFSKEILRMRKGE